MGGDRQLHEPQQTIWCTSSWVSHTVRGGIDRGDNLFRLRLMGVIDIRKVFCSEDGIVRTLPGCRWLHEPQSISNQPVGLRVQHPAGRYRHGRPPILSPVCWSCMYGRISDLGMGY